MTGPVSSLHCLDSGVPGRHSSFYVVGGALNDNDCVIDHDADSQNQGEKRHQINGKTECGHRDESADNGDRDGCGGNEHRPEALEEKKHHDQHQDSGYEKSFIHLRDGFADKQGRVIADCLFESFGKSLAHIGHRLIDAVGDA